MSRRWWLPLAALLALLMALPAAAAQWQVDPAKSRIGFTATWLGKPVDGVFKAWSAAIDFDPAKPDKAAVTVLVDLASAVSGDRTVDGALPGDDWFAVKANPRAKFVTTSIAKTATGWLAKGTLTIRGKTVPVDLPFTLAIAGDTATMQGSARLDRRAWQIGAESDATADYVAFPVTVKVSLVAKRSK